jgi:hypothetical protein
MTYLGYHLRDITQGEKQSNKKKKIGIKNSNIQIQGRELGVHVNPFRILKPLLKRLNKS